jgi:hypothetical protein
MSSINDRLSQSGRGGNPPSARCLNKWKAAQYLGISASLLETTYRYLGFKIGNSLLYDIEDLDKFVEETKRKDLKRIKNEV